MSLSTLKRTSASAVIQLYCPNSAAIHPGLASLGPCLDGPGGSAARTAVLDPTLKPDYAEEELDNYSAEPVATSAWIPKSPRSLPGGLKLGGRFPESSHADGSLPTSPDTPLDCGGVPEFPSEAHGQLDAETRELIRTFLRMYTGLPQRRSRGKALETLKRVVDSVVAKHQIAYHAVVRLQSRSGLEISDQPEPPPPEPRASPVSENRPRARGGFLRNGGGGREFRSGLPRADKAAWPMKRRVLSGSRSPCCLDVKPGMIAKLGLEQKGEDVSFVTGVAKSLFSDGKTNWGRIASLVSFGAVVAKQMKDSGRERCVEAVGQAISDYLLQDQREWLLNNRGWDGFVEFFHVEDPESTIRNALMAFAGVAGLGAGLALLIR
ncbi:MCL1 protein, partial [Atractosteus spatula]|nr:MCL1 protein [Atractosteus spatula]